VRRLLLLLPLLAIVGAARGEEHKEREFQECIDCPVMVGIPAGSFIMGSPANEPGHFDNEGPQHAVSVRAFALAKYPVTSEQFLSFLQATGYKPAPCNERLDLRWHPAERNFARPPVETEPPQWPAVCLEWKDAQAYIAWLNAKVRAARGTGGRDGPYRLPTEAEWEYAARGGLEGADYGWGEELSPGGAVMANYWRGTFPYSNLRADGYRTTPVTAFPANGYGLHDMIGNVWEWTTDWYRPGHEVETASPCCLPTGHRGGVTGHVGGVEEESYDPCATGARIPRRVLKGGSHLCAPNYCRRYRPAARFPQPIDTSTCHVGFRCIVRAPLDGSAAGPEGR